MKVYAVFGAPGAGAAFYGEDLFPPVPVPGPVFDTDRNPAIPVDAIEVTEDQRAEFLANPGGRQWVGGALVPYDPPAETPGPVRVQKIDIWRRATDAEADQLVALLASQTTRLQRMFNDAIVISSADEMWPTLIGGVTQLLGADRAAVLLASSTP